jgi:hypothetical protein
VVPILRDEGNRSFWLECSMQVTKDDLKKRLARYRQIRVSVIGRAPRRAISPPDPSVNRPKITDVIYLLGQKSRTL